MPSYNTIRSEGLVPLSVSSLVFNGVTYSGETGRNKKEAEQLAARAVILSLLGIFLLFFFFFFLKIKTHIYIYMYDFKPHISWSSSLYWTNNADDPRYGIFLSEIIKSKAKLLEEVPEFIDLTIACVPSVVEQASGVGENSLRKRCRKILRAEHGDTDNE